MLIGMSANTPVLVRHERCRVEQHLTDAYRFLAKNPWKSVHSWFVTAVEEADGRRWLSDLLEFPPAMDGLMLQQLFGSDCAFSKTSLALAARRLFYLLRPFNEVASSPYAPADWAELFPALNALLDSCRPFTLAQPLTWPTLWELVGEPEEGKPNPLQTVNLESYITFALDGRDFSILEVINSWRHGGVADDAWEQRRSLSLDWIIDLLRQWSPDGGAQSKGDRLMLETAWWALETGVWLSSRDDRFPEGCPSVPEWAVPHLKSAISDTVQLLGHLREVGRPDVSPPPVDAQYKIRLASTPEVFSPDRSVLFAAKNGMRLASRIRLAAWLNPAATGAECLSDLDGMIEGACHRVIALRDNGHLWWAQQRLCLLYDWIDYYRLKATINALRRNRGEADDFTLECIQKRNNWLLAPEIVSIVDDIAQAIRTPLTSVAKGGDPKNREMSIVLLAGPGTGKSTLVKSVVHTLASMSGVQIDGNYNERKLQHLPTQEAFRGWLESSTRPRAKVQNGDAGVPVVFLDELHLTPQECDQYAELLACLEDNVVLSAQGHGAYKVEADRIAVFIFATSKYLDQWSFVREAQAKQDQAMVDFHTRIAKWQSILPLEFMPLQRVAIFCGSQPTGLRAADLIWIGTTTHPDFATGRGVSNAAKIAEGIRQRMSEELRARFGLDESDVKGSVVVAASSAHAE